MTDSPFDPDEVAAVRRYYEGMMKKHVKRLRSLDARGVPDERRHESRRAIAKYEIVLHALNRV